jgi:hypothetical protein
MEDRSEEVDDLAELLEEHETQLPEDFLKKPRNIAGVPGHSMLCNEQGEERTLLHEEIPHSGAALGREFSECRGDNELRGSILRESALWD